MHKFLIWRSQVSKVSNHENLLHFSVTTRLGKKDSDTETNDAMPPPLEALSQTPIKHNPFTCKLEHALEKSRSKQKN